jgi:hypothetical protein
MKVRIKYKKPAKNHSLGFCEECGEQFDVFHNGRKEFMAHAYKTGHFMILETAYHQHYNSKE